MDEDSREGMHDGRHEASGPRGRLRSIVMARRVLTCTQCTASGAMAIGRERGVRL